MDLLTTEIPALVGMRRAARMDAPAEECACVLVVDDNPGKLLSLSAIISAMGLEVVTACSGRAALRQLLERDFALILLDVNMPAMDGYETAQLIHSRPRSAHTPIIFITAEAASESERFKAYTVGAVDWIFSPIVPEILQAKVSVFIDLYYLTRIAQRQTEQLRQHAEDIERKNAQLEEVSRLKSGFLANMSHELRTPLNAIIGFAALMQDGFIGDLTTQQKDAVTHIRDSGNHLLSLINDILDLSKVEAGQMALEPEPEPIAALFEASLAVVREKARAQHIVVRLELEEGLGEIAVDARKVRQILFNLLSNAVKFTPDEGEVCLAARRVRRADVNENAPEGMAARIVPLPPSGFDDFLEIQVGDSGIGIAEPDMRRLFNSFVQVDSSISRRFDGTGLGLALVRQLAALHGGTVGVVSAPGKGSRFLVWLPWRTADADASQRLAPAKTEHGMPAAAALALGVAPALSQRAETQGTARPLALVIEANDESAQILATDLDHIGFRVSRAVDVETGLLQAARESPALITLDLLLPGMDGWEALARINANSALTSIPVVIVALAAEDGRGYALGAIEVLQKPVSRSTLIKVLGTLGLMERQRKPLVLAVDDDPLGMELVAISLAAAGCDVVRAYGGQAAIATARQVLPDLVILDLMMPTIDGFDVVEALKARSDSANVPILILTAKEVTRADRERLNGNVMGIVQKSVFRSEGFEREVKRAMSKKAPSVHSEEGS